MYIVTYTTYAAAMARLCVYSTTLGGGGEEIRKGVDDIPTRFSDGSVRILGLCFVQKW